MNYCHIQQQTENQLEFTIASSTEAVEKGLLLSHRHFSGLSPHFYVILRELLNNAVTHGNHLVPDALAACSIERLSENQWKITVKDEGAGFAYRNLNTDLPDNPLYVRKRGYKLIYALSESVEFNNTGNRVSIIFDQESGPEYTERKEGESLSDMQKKHRAPPDKKFYLIGG